MNRVPVMMILVYRQCQHTVIPTYTVDSLDVYFPYSNHSNSFRPETFSCVPCSFQVVLPYIHAKMERLYRHYSVGVLGLALSAQGNSSGELRERSGNEMSAARRTLTHRLGRAVLSAFVAGYPYLNAGLQGTQFVYHLCYLLGIPSQVDIPHSPVLHALGLQMGRVSAEDMVR